MSPREADEFRISLNSKFGGTEMFLGLIDNQVIVMKIFEGNPAHRAGISVGDELLQVDDMSTKGKTMDDVISRLRGNPGAKVKIPGYDVTVKKAVEVLKDGEE